MGAPAEGLPSCMHARSVGYGNRRGGTAVAIRVVYDRKGSRRGEATGWQTCNDAETAAYDSIERNTHYRVDVGVKPIANMYHN